MATAFATSIGGFGEIVDLGGDEGRIAIGVQPFLGVNQNLPLLKSVPGIIQPHLHDHLTYDEKFVAHDEYGVPEEPHEEYGPPPEPHEEYGPPPEPLPLCPNGAPDGSYPFCCVNGAVNPFCCENGASNEFCCLGEYINPTCSAPETTTTTTEPPPSSPLPYAAKIDSHYGSSSKFL